MSAACAGIQSGVSPLKRPSNCAVAIPATSSPGQYEPGRHTRGAVAPRERVARTVVVGLELDDVHLLVHELLVERRPVRKDERVDQERHVTREGQTLDTARRDTSGV